MDRDWLERLRSTTAEHADARQLPREAFVTQAAFDLDRSIHLSAWLPVCHVSEIAFPGAFFAVEVLGERLLVVRGADLELGAFFDRCAHRGTPLTEGEQGRLERLELVCPYHGLAYDLRGRAREPHATRLAVGGRTLERAWVAERFGFVFVAAREPARSLHDEVAPPWLERGSLHALRLARRVRYEVLANWKLCVENFQESHHFASVHPRLERLTPFSRSSSHDFGGRFLGGSMELVDGAETVSESASLLGRRFVAAEQDRRTVRDAHLFPGWLTSLQPDYFLSYRVQPLDPGRTRVVAEIFVHAESPRAAEEDLFVFWDRTNAEDRSICERQQRGVSAASYGPGPYGPSEDGVHAFDRLVATEYLRLAATV
ncbi:MAG: aromatic ring-hydroxylating dioxygenase subunit alpha [Myxococcales bacterium]|nr:aromatic ring-hydroxylating dioxygenase subunit alpha [Myxococcales bacterium]